MRTNKNKAHLCIERTANKIVQIHRNHMYVTFKYTHSHIHVMRVVTENYIVRRTFSLTAQVSGSGVPTYSQPNNGTNASVYVSLADGENVWIGVRKKQLSWLSCNSNVEKTSHAYITATSNHFVSLLNHSNIFMGGRWCVVNQRFAVRKTESDL